MHTIASSISTTISTVIIKMVMRMSSWPLSVENTMPYMLGVRNVAAEIPWGGEVLWWERAMLLCR